MPQLLANKRAFHDYEILERIEAGLELLGTEVKSLRLGQGKLTGAHALVRGNEVFIVGMQVPAYQPKNSSNSYDPERTRRLLLSKKEIAELSGLSARKGHTIIPLAVYTKGKRIKIELGVARGKKSFDKREDIKKRDDKRDMARAMRNKG